MENLYYTLLDPSGQGVWSKSVVGVVYARFRTCIHRVSMMYLVLQILIQTSSGSETNSWFDSKKLRHASHTAYTALGLEADARCFRRGCNEV